MPTPKYEKPPITEVVFDVSFNSLEEFHSEHLGLFWSKIRKDFPRCEQAIPYDDHAVEYSEEVFPMPRYWFISECDSQVLQIQKNHLAFNWRRGSGKKDYPHYEAVKASFEKYLKKFSDFIAEEKLGILEVTGAQLSYSNAIYENEGWNSFSEIPKILPQISFPNQHMLSEHISGLSLSYAYLVPNNVGTLVIKAHTAIEESKNKKLLRLELILKGDHRFDNVKETLNWFDVSHEQIVSTFAKITDDEIQLNLWKKRK